MSGMSPAASQPIDVYLKPGEYFVGDASHRIRTVLGSCVSVALWHPLRRIGAMSHFMLASRGVGAVAARLNAAALDARYADEALELMLDELAARNVAAADCKAKVFGGGDMFPGRGMRAGLAVGRRNGEAACTLLRARGIELTSQSLYGEGHRQIIFEVETGHVWSRQVEPAVHSQQESGRGCWR
jgi:chemotaxis protein CheD